MTIFRQSKISGGGNKCLAYPFSPVLPTTTAAAVNSRKAEQNWRWVHLSSVFGFSRRQDVADWSASNSLVTRRSVYSNTTRFTFTLLFASCSPQGCHAWAYLAKNVNWGLSSLSLSFFLSHFLFFLPTSLLSFPLFFVLLLFPPLPPFLLLKLARLKSSSGFRSVLWVSPPPKSNLIHYVLKYEIWWQQF